MNYFLNRAKELEQELIAMRRELHSYAELGFDLPKTNAFVTEKLRSYGCLLYTSLRRLQRCGEPVQQGSVFGRSPASQKTVHHPLRPAGL